MKDTYPWISRSIINHHYSSRQKNLKDLTIMSRKSIDQLSTISPLTDISNPSSNDEVTTVSYEDACSSSRKCPGRPKDLTISVKHHKKKAILAMHNEIATRFQKERAECGFNKRLKRGRLDEIINEVKTLRNLEDVSVTKDSIRKQISRNKPIAGTRGHSTPMEEVEPCLLQLFIQLGRIRAPVSNTEGLSLANSLIIGMPIEQKIIDWKKKYSYYRKSDDVLGTAYWRGFLSRYEHLIVRKRGEKFAMARDDWSKYSNFEKMYESVYDEMVNAGVATKLDEPAWMDIHGNFCLEEDTFGQKCTHHLLYPEMCFVGDEIGSNISQKGDGHVGGQMFIVERGVTPKKRCSVKDHHFTVMGLTSLTGEPVMCVVIIAGVVEAFNVSFLRNYKNVTLFLSHIILQST